MGDSTPEDYNYDELTPEAEESSKIVPTMIG
jgi:hypothetical protein